ncbi:MAG: ATPase central domain-containing [Geobacteraceae bacterium]|nr:MAG: ATPase central domain-containing [Geobacteraceae bacterium]
MASSEQLKALLQSHIEGDNSRFFSIAMQVAAHEAKLGHGKLAEELRSMIDAAKSYSTTRQPLNRPVPINQPRGELSGLLEVSYPKTRLSDMVLDGQVESKLKRIIKEQRNFAKIREHGLFPRRKLLLVGPPGTGKTMTASVLAGELGIPLFLVRLDSLITKFMGETASKLRQVFDAISDNRAVFFFDEFDAIGSQRGLSNDIGEIRRVLNSFLQMIEQDGSNSVIIAATNHQELLDYAVFRRFDDVIEYGLPQTSNIVTVLKSKLANFKLERLKWKSLATSAEGLSYADICRAAEEAIKDAIIHDRAIISETELKATLEDRKSMRIRPSDNK